MEAPHTADGCSFAHVHAELPQKGVLLMGNTQRRKNIGIYPSGSHLVLMCMHI